MSAPQSRPDVAELMRKSAMAVTAIENNLAHNSDEDMIETNVRSLRNLAEIIAGLSTVLDNWTAHGDLPGEDSFQPSQSDEFRFWVPVDHHGKVRKAAEAACKDRDHYKAALARIADGALAPSHELSILHDWEGAARSLQSIAQASLNHKASA